MLPGRLLAVVIALTFASAGVAAADDTPKPAECPAATNLTTGHVRDVSADGSLTLADGAALRFAGIDFPELQAPGPGSPETIAAIKQAVGGDIGFAAVGQPDRHNRTAADVRTADGKSIAGLLVDAGLARVHPLPGESACFSDLLQRERIARQKRNGLWRGHEYAIRDADQSSLAGRNGLYDVVEGRVVAVNRGTRVVFLDFGRNWQRDFTVMIGTASAKRFDESGVSLEALAGHRVRVRGVIEEAGGRPCGWMSPTHWRFGASRMTVSGTGTEGRRCRWWFTAALAVAGGAALSGCNSLSDAGGTPSTAVTAAGNIAPTLDTASAEENGRIVAAYGGVYHDAKVEQTVARIVGRVVASSDKPSQSYRLTILNSPTVNAFALPGGYIYVTRGLLALADDSSEVAAVLGHEIGHITANHAMERQDKARNALIVSRVATDVLPDGAGKLALASTQRSLATFSQQQELEADAIGVRTIGKAGYDPFAAARFLKAMAAFSDYRSASGSTADKRPDFLASHPSTPERVDFATRAARQFGAPGVGDVDQDRYLEGIDGLIYGDDPSQGYVRERSYVHPSLGIGFSVPPGFVIDNTSDAVLATGTDGTALRFDAVSLTAGADLGAYLASGWVNGLVEGSIQKMTVNGMPAAIGNANAKGWVFEIAVVQAPSGATYRFIFANETKTPGFDAAALSTVKSFRRLTDQEVAALKPLRVRLVVAQAGDTADTFARRMQGVDRPTELFRVLNNIDAGAPIPAGTKVKIISD